MSGPLRPDIPPHVAEIIRRLPPDLKRSVRNALRTLSEKPESGEPLRRELAGLWKYRVRRFRIVYAIDRRRRSSG
jgi:mRNA interferase RelE/StbE